MSFEYFIASRIGGNSSQKLSKPVVRISKISIAVGLALMIASVAIVIGFKNSIRDKIEGFASDIRLVLFDNNMGMQNDPLLVTRELIESLKNYEEISYFQRVAHKAGVIKTDDQILGVMLKGIGSDYNSDFLVNSLIKGRIPQISDTTKSNDVLISQTIAGKLNIVPGDDLRLWFIDKDESGARGRKLKVSGIYSTGVEEIDNLYIIGDIRHIQKLNNWSDNEIGSIEIFVKNKESIPNTSFSLYNILPYNIRAISVYEEYPQIYNWLGLLDMNVVVILSLLIVVSTITMISTLLILIMERTSMVGLLKALGSSDQSIRKLFLYRAINIIITGLLWGNIMGISFYFIQRNYELIKLSAESYSVDHVPVELYFTDVILLNIGTLILSLFVLIIPTWYITRIEPAKALRYE